MKESVEIGSSSRWLAFYRGLKVTVYSMNKSEVNLTRQDLIELVNVRSLLPTCDLSPLNNCTLFVLKVMLLSNKNYVGDVHSQHHYSRLDVVLEYLVRRNISAYLCVCS